MEYESMGKFIQALRKEKGLTQRQLADMLNITDKAVSKWERDVACPDTATLPKLAEILGVTVDELLNAKNTQKQSDGVVENVGDRNPDAEMYKERLKKHLLLGIPGFVIGFVAMLVAIVCFSVERGILSELSMLDYPVAILLTFLMAFEIGLALAGVPHGWKLVDRFFGRWIIYGNLFVMIMVPLLKLVFAIWVGLVSYPVMLVYYIIRSRKTKRKVRMWTIIAVSVVVLIYATVGAAVYIVKRTDDGKNAATGSSGVTVVETVDAEAVVNQGVIQNELVENTLNDIIKNENEAVTELGWVVTEASKIHGVFFAEAKDLSHPHYVSRNLSLSNAVVIVAGYFIAEAGPSQENKWEMEVKVYPNFFYNEDGTIEYNREGVFTHYLREKDMDDLMNWFVREYSDMNITEIPYQ